MRSYFSTFSIDVRAQSSSAIAELLEAAVVRSDGRQLSANLGGEVV